MKPSIFTFLKEIVIVVLGVLIAVSLNNFKQKLDNDRYLDKTLDAIEKEIQESRAEVDTVMAKHYRLVDSVVANIEDEELGLGSLLGEFGGIQSPSIKNVGLRFFIANKAELVEYELITQLSAIENSTNILEVKMDRMIDFVYENINDRSVETKTIFLYYLSNVIDSEETLLELYGNFDELRTTEEDI